jgi:cell division inhibitor SepF
MSFWDNVKKFTQPLGDDDYDDYDDEEMDEYEDELDEPAPRRRASFTSEDSDLGSAPVSAPVSAAPSGFNAQVLNMSAGKHEIVLFRAATFADASKAADDLRSKKQVILNMENVDKALSRRVVDFLTGCVYALDGEVRKVAQATYLFCPHGMDIVGDLENLQNEVDSYI